MKIPFREDSYKDDNVSAFGTKPNTTIDEFQYLFNKSWSVLDVGRGDGKNSLYLSGVGYTEVEAFDFSESAIAKLNRIATSKNLHITAWVRDLTRFTFSKQYDLVMSFGTLHFAGKEHRKRFILDAKENTRDHGVHIIQLFTNVLPASPDIAPFAVGLADDEEIKRLYNDLDIIRFKSYTFEDEHPNVPKHYHASNKIVVQKK